MFQEESFTHGYHSGNMWLDRKSPNSRDKTEMAIASGLMFFSQILSALQDVTVISILERMTSLLNKFGETLG